MPPPPLALPESSPGFALIPQTGRSQASGENQSEGASEHVEERDSRAPLPGLTTLVTACPEQGEGELWPPAGQEPAANN